MFRKVVVVFFLLLIFSCSSNELSYVEGDLKIEIKEGKEWIHPFELFLGIKKDNPPQFALWVEDLDGNYLETIVVTRRVSNGSWVANDGNKRVEALPLWTNKIGYIPTEDESYNDGLTTATPKSGFPVNVTPLNQLKKFVIKFEVNHSTDYNSYYTSSASSNEDSYSGGEGGSGQPALVYEAIIDMDLMDSINLQLIGHSSPDGSNGEIYSDISNITSALEIIEYVKVTKI